MSLLSIGENNLPRGHLSDAEPITNYFQNTLLLCLSVALLLTIFLYLKKNHKFVLSSLANLPSRFRSLFAFEWTWRLFIVLLLLGFFNIVYLDMKDSWNVFPYDFNLRILHSGYPRLNWRWDIFNGSYWNTYSRNNQNWIFLLCLIAPFLITKAIDWIVSAKDK